MHVSDHKAIPIALEPLQTQPLRWTVQGEQLLGGLAQEKHPQQISTRKLSV